MLAIYRHDLTKCRALHKFLIWWPRITLLLRSTALSYMVKSEHFSDFHIKEIACELDFNRWVGSTLPFLLSAHHPIGAYFLTTEGDKRMRLITRLYGSHNSHSTVRHVILVQQASGNLCFLLSKLHAPALPCKCAFN